MKGTCVALGISLLALPLIISEAYAAPFCRGDLKNGEICVDDVNFEVKVKNSKPVPVTVSFGITEIEEATSIPPLPLDLVVPPKSEVSAFRYRANPRYKNWNFRYYWNWELGDYRQNPNLDVIYDLPFALGCRVKMSWGPNGTASHKGIQAYDFDIPEGTPIHAARAGVVAHVEESYEVASKDPPAPNNEVKILHDDGSLAHYLHLKKNGVVVGLGEKVFKGELLGFSGNVGFTSAAHLHFHVSATSVQKRPSRAVPLWFRTNESARIQLKDQQFYSCP
jgi:murein DD-endopeptidase MepM/ murein hydrolase activator NlpD